MVTLCFRGLEQGCSNIQEKRVLLAAQNYRTLLRRSPDPETSILAQHVFYFQSRQPQGTPGRDMAIVRCHVR